MTWLTTQRGFVNTWECDENDHLNIQHYFGRLADAAVHFLVARGVAPFAPGAPRLLSRHVRFLRELSAEDLTRVESASIRLDGLPEGAVAVAHRLEEPTRGFLAAGAVDLYAASDGTDLGRDAVPAPEEARPRSLPLAPAAEPRSLPDLLALGYREIDCAVVQPVHLGPDGTMSVAAIAGRVSAGSGHAYASAGIPRSEIDEAGRGRVTAELKITPLAPARAGDPVVTVSGVTSLSRATLVFRHVTFDAATGAALAVAEKTALILDRGTRKAVPISRELRAAITANLVES